MHIIRDTRFPVYLLLSRVLIFPVLLFSLSFPHTFFFSTWSYACNANRDTQTTPVITITISSTNYVIIITAIATITRKLFHLFFVPFRRRSSQQEYLFTRIFSIVFFPLSIYFSSLFTRHTRVENFHFGSSGNIKKRKVVIIVYCFFMMTVRKINAFLWKQEFFQ